MPLILFIDDNPPEIAGIVDQVRKCHACIAEHPNDVTIDQLRDADLVLLDQRLENWEERDGVAAVALQPLDGVALASVLRSHLAKQTDSPTAFAILSNHVAELAGNLPPEHRAQAIARTHNLEWVFQKHTKASILADQICDLAIAVTALPQRWPVDSEEALENSLVKLLNLPESEWQARALRDVASCHPPVHELSLWSHGIAFLRWFLQRILPYPTFLWDSFYLAARLRCDAAQIDSLINTPGFAKLFDPAKYSGVLSSFLGARWWRSGVESILWEHTNREPFDSSSVRKLLHSATRETILTTSAKSPIVTRDVNLGRPVGLLDSEMAVRVMLDDWPPYAEEAWVSLEVANSDPLVAALVVESDRDRLEGNR
jgi:hypothetical protein